MQGRSFTQANPEPPPDNAALFDRYGPVIFAYILKQLRSFEDAEDLTAEVFTAAMENATIRLLSSGEQLAWLKRVTHNKLVDFYRRAQRRINVNIDIFVDTLYDNEEPEQLILQREANHQLHQYIKQLSPEQQQIIYLRYSHNLRTLEIATLLNKSDAAIRKQLARARALLRACYLDQEGGR